MKLILNRRLIVCSLTLILQLMACFEPHLASSAVSEESTVQLKSGEMGFLPFLEMVSEQLDLQMDASGLESVPTTVTVPEAGPLSPEKAKSLVLSTLYLQGYTWIHDAGRDLYRISRHRDARDQEIPLITDASQLPESDLWVTHVIRVEHVSPDYLARVIRSFMSANSRIIPDETTGAILVTDSSRNISRIRKMIQQVDTVTVAKQATEWLAAQNKKAETNCAQSSSRPLLSSGLPGYPPGVLVALFSLISLVIGFLLRGFMIRRIEGGL